VQEVRGFIAEEQGVSQGESVSMALSAKYVYTLLDAIEGAERSTSFSCNASFARPITFATGGHA